MANFFSLYFKNLLYFSKFIRPTSSIHPIVMLGDEYTHEDQHHQIINTKLQNLRRDHLDELTIYNAPTIFISRPSIIWFYFEP